MFKRQQPVNVFVPPAPQGRPYPQDVTVHEHRAPTDESARMILEHEEAARGRILDQLSVTDNTFSMSFVAYTVMEDESILVTWRYKLNGMDRKGEFKMKQRDLEQAGLRSAIIEHVYTEAVKEVVAQSLGQILAGIPQSM